MNKIRKKIISLGVAGALSLLPGVSGYASFSSREGDCYNTSEVFIYDKDSLDGEVIGSLDVYSSFIKLCEGEECSLINYRDHIGFVDNSKIESISVSSNNHSFQQMNHYGVTTTNVNLRSGASTDEAVIEVVSKGEDLQILSLVDNNWYLVDHHNTLGFLASEYVNVINNDTIEDEVSRLPDIIKVVVAKDEVHVRKEPSTESKSLGVMKKGYQVHMVRQLDDWYEVENNGKIGYVNCSYVKEKYAINGDAYLMVSMIGVAPCYNYPFGDLIGYLPQYESAKVYGETSHFYLVESEGRIGYVNKNDCVKLEGVYVIVDISSQKMVQYNGMTPVIQSNVVTGKDTTPTDLGLYSIHTKERNRELVGADYSVVVDYWMGFNDSEGEGLHDLNRSSYGGEKYHKEGSHGCVNLPYQVAENLYQNVSVGNKVLVKQ